MRKILVVLLTLQGVGLNVRDILFKKPPVSGEICILDKQCNYDSTYSASAVFTVKSTYV